MANVRFIKTTKEKHLARAVYDPNALYFCEDTQEIFKGQYPYTDGIRVIPTKADLPSCPNAADGVVYFIAETKSGYMMSPDRTEWLQTIYAPVTDAYEIPESEMYSTVTTVGAVRDIEAKIYKTIDERIANIPGADIDLSDYVKQEDITDFATKEFVQAKIAEAELADQDVDLSAYYTKSETEAAIASAVDAIEVPDISGLATKEELEAVQNVAGSNSVKLFAIDEELLDIKEQLENIPTTDLTQYYTKSEVDEIIPDVSGFATKDELQEAIDSIEHPVIDLAGYATKEEVATVEAKIPSVEGLATKQELEEAIASIEHPTVDLTGYATTEAVEAIADELAQTQSQLDHVTNGVENLQRVVGNLDATVVKQKYEVFPLEGMFIQYNDNEIRVNTQHVDIATLPPQNAGDGSSDSYYYATFRAYAPAGATSVIEGSSDKMDTEHSELAVDSYGRKYTTIWSAIASKSGSTWSKFGDRSNVDKYIGFYYNFHWYAGDKLISKEKVRVILTNDACHNDLVPDAVARRIDDKVSTVTTTVNNLSETVENIENTYVTNETLEQKNYVTEQYVTNNYITQETANKTYVTTEKVTEVVETQVNEVVTKEIETKVTEVIEQKIEDGNLVANADAINYDTW